MSLSMQCRLERGTFSLEVDLVMPSRSVIGIVGENGSGKTSTLDMIAGLLPCTTGIISIDGVVVDHSTTNVFIQPEDRQAATVFQGGGLLPHLSVERNVAFGRGRALRTTERFDEIVDAFDLRDLVRRRPHELSGGQRQRVSLARAFLAPSRVLLLDEPTTFLDAASRSQAHSRSRHERDSGHARRGRGPRHGRPRLGLARGAVAAPVVSPLLPSAHCSTTRSRVVTWAGSRRTPTAFS